MIIQGFVEEDVRIEKNTARYTLLAGPAGEERIRVISRGKQALKDALFIRKDQRVTVNGRRIKGNMFAERAWIDIRLEKDK